MVLSGGRGCAARSVPLLFVRARKRSPAPEFSRTARSSCGGAVGRPGCVLGRLLAVLSGWQRYMQATSPAAEQRGFMFPGEERDGRYARRASLPVTGPASPVSRREVVERVLEDGRFDELAFRRSLAAAQEPAPVTAPEALCSYRVERTSGRTAALQPRSRPLRAALDDRHYQPRLQRVGTRLRRREAHHGAATRKHHVRQSSRLHPQ